MAKSDTVKAAGMVRARGEPSFVLSAQPWKETSLIAELFTQRYGRVTVVVRGAKRVSSRFRGLINPFVPLLTSFSGSGDIKNLTDARWLGGLAPVEGDALMSAFYVNELMVRLTMRGDPSPALFAAYTQVLGDLALKTGRELSLSLRRFELALLASLGWSQAAKLDEISAGGTWIALDGELVRVCELPAGETPVSVATARAMALSDAAAAPDLRELRDVLRRIIGYYVGRNGFKTRLTLERWSQI